jgi:hypothetical protein
MHWTMIRFLQAWQAGIVNLRGGFAITRRQPDLYVLLVILYSLPALAAAGLVLYGAPDLPWYEALVFGLPWITVAVAPVVVMKAVDAGRAGERISVLEATRRGMPSVPRYVWTNVHTTVLFWVPVGALVLLRDWSPLGELLPPVAWLALIGAVAIHQHVRTVLAPYLAVHADFYGTHAALASWHLGGRHFWGLLGTFTLGAAPVAVPLAVAYALAEQFGPVPLSTALLAASTQLGWVAIQSVRPVLIPALYTAYQEICDEQDHQVAHAWATDQIQRWHASPLARVPL